MARKPVTEATVGEYLRSVVDGGNYALFHGLHKLSKERFLAVMDLLINGETFPDELVHLGSFTDAEADAFIRRVGTRWDGRFMGTPTVAGSGGYEYYLNTLGLRNLLDATRVLDQWYPMPVRIYTGVNFRTGATGHHPSVASLVVEYESRGVPAGLAAASATALQELFPPDEAGIRALPIPNKSVEREDLFYLWVSSLFAPLLSSGGTTEGVLRALYGVDDSLATIARAPSFTHFLLSGLRPYADTQLRLHQEIAANREGTPITAAQAAEYVEGVKLTRPSEWGSAATVSEMDFNLRLAGAWGDVHNGGVYPTDFQIARDALQALFDYRDRLRRYTWASYKECLEWIYGEYPGGENLVPEPYTIPSFSLTPGLNFVTDAGGNITVG